MSAHSNFMAGVRSIVLLSTLCNARCGSPSPALPPANGNPAQRTTGATSSRESNVVVGDGAQAAKKDAPVEVIPFEEFKERCRKRFERIDVTNLVRPYEGRMLTLKISLDRTGDGEYTIRDGGASISSPEGSTEVRLRGRMSLSMSRAKERIVGTVDSFDVDVLFGGVEVANRRLWKGFEGECPLELAREKDGFRGYLSLVVPLVVGGVDVAGAFALPCELSSDRSQMLLGGEGVMDPRDLYIVAPKVITGGFILRGDVAVGATGSLRIVHGPRNATYVLYESDQLAEKTGEFDGSADWWLEVASQVVVAKGTLDSEGEATIKIAIPDDVKLVGSYRFYQALVESEGSRLSTGPGVVKILGK
jgi:hypothetical protein